MSQTTLPPDTGCIFCRIIAGQLPASRVFEDDVCLALMDVFPLRPGHVLVMPKTHGEYLADLSPAVRAHLLETANRIAQAMRRSPLAPDGIHSWSTKGERLIRPSRIVISMCCPAGAVICLD